MLCKTFEVKKHLENKNQNELVLPKWLLQEPIENKVKNIYNPKSLKQLAKENIKVDQKQLNKELAKKMINPYYFTDRALRVGFNFTLEGQHIIHANSKLIIKPNCPEFGIEVCYIKKIIKELSVIFARLINQFNFRYETVFSTRFDKQHEANQVLDETELFNSLNINHNLTETDLDNIDAKSPLEHQLQQPEMKYSIWRFDNINSMIIFFSKLVK